MNELEESWNKYADLTIKEITKVSKSALKKAAATLKANTQCNVVDLLGDAAVSRGRYFDTLVDGVRVTKYNNTEDSIAVHIMGSRSSSSGTFRLRFFEGGTSGRMTTGRGNTPYSNGDITALRFFESAMSSTPVDDIILTQIDKAVEKINNTNLSYSQAKGR